ncbi:hypothetical protein [Mycolicibacterium setense]
MNPWQQDSQWFRPVLGIDSVAELFDIQPSSVRRYLTEHSGFPEPSEQRGNRNFWTPASIYRHIWNTRPTRIQHIPRLCPLTDDLGPARFVESEIVETRGRTYVLHTWQPGDGRGPVGVAYSRNFELTNSDAAAHLLSLRSYLSAIALAGWGSGMQEPHQPTISVADHAGTDWYPWEIGWLDLAALLHVDIPWWSHGLTDIITMNAWRPGTPIAHIRPQLADFTAEHFEQCRPHDGSPADHALAELAATTDHALAVASGIWPNGHDDFPNRPGLQHAAMAILGPQPSIPASPDTIREALRHRVTDNDRAIRAVKAASGFEVLLPAITYQLLTIDGNHHSTLAGAWRDRLEPVDPLHRNEIGYHWVAHCMEQPPQQWWRDPLNPTVWAISDADGAIHATLGTRMPARGRIEEITIEDRCPFFRDSSGHTFPVPSSGGSVHRTLGSGSIFRLAAAILRLMNDASRDVYRCDTDTDVLDVQATGLYEVISHCRDAFTLSRSDLEELALETEHGAARREEIRAQSVRFR